MNFAKLIKTTENEIENIKTTHKDTKNRNSKHIKKRMLKAKLSAYKQCQKIVDDAIENIKVNTVDVDKINTWVDIDKLRESLGLNHGRQTKPELVAKGASNAVDGKERSLVRDKNVDTNSWSSGDSNADSKAMPETNTNDKKRRKK